MKITEYQKVTSLAPNDIMLIDGAGGTRTIEPKDAIAPQLEELKDEIDDDISDLDEAKANVNGYYSMLTAGRAENLLDTRATGVARNFTFGTTAGTDSVEDLGTAEIKSIHGRTLVWNQLVGTDTATVTLETGKVYFTRVSGVESRVTGDGTEVTVSSGDAVHNLTKMFGAGKEPATAADFEAMFPRTDYAYDAGSLLNFTGSGIKTVGFNLLDLSTGKANVPAGDAQITGAFTALTAPDGTSITPDEDGYFTSVGGEYAVTGADDTTCVHLVWSGYRDGEYEDYWTRTLDLPIATYFPDGMRSAGNVYDELTTGKAIKRIGSYTFTGNENWLKDSSATNSNRFSIAISAFSGVKYLTTNAIDTLGNRYIASGMGTDQIGVASFNQSAHVYYMRVPKTVDTKEDMQDYTRGNTVYYELAEPVETAITVPLNLTYQVDDFGTEQLLPENDDEPATSPFSGVIAYSTDFTRQVANMPKNYTSQSTLDELLEAIGTAVGGTFTKTWDAANGKWTFTFEEDAAE